MSDLTSAEMRAALTGTPWDEMSVNGEPTFLLCPTCAAVIRVPQRGDPYDGRERHTDWHVTTLEATLRLGGFIRQVAGRTRRMAT